MVVDGTEWAVRIESVLEQPAYDQSG